MSFSRSVKQELARIRLRTAGVRRAQLYGLTHAAGALRLGRSFGVEYVTETYEVARQIAALSTGLYDVTAEVSLRETERRLTLIVVNLAGAGCEKLLVDAGLFLRTENGPEFAQNLPEDALVTEDARRAFLRGFFMGAGSCTDPKRAYHLELICRSEAEAEALCAMLVRLDVEAKSVRRKEKSVVYLKEGDRIAAFLALIGASAATLAFEDARAEKELRNYINRTSNCETANIGKTVNAAGEQLDAIAAILRHKSVRLTPTLRQAAELRVNHPDASLQELAELAGIGKSGMNHRLERLKRIARELH